ncbi:hypothetical protein [Sinobacterium caligoides]|nr:hypothetical protein [Sinobacterium caligoides]
MIDSTLTVGDEAVSATLSRHDKRVLFKRDKNVGGDPADGKRRKQ